MTITIELTPYEAAAIYAFLREWFNESNSDVNELQAMHSVVNSFENEMLKKWSYEVNNDAIAECEINFLLGRQPKNRGGKPMTDY